MDPGTGPAYLGVAHKPFETNADPANPGPFRLPNFSLPDGITLERVADRRGLLDGFDRLRRDVDATGQMDAQDEFKARAWDILTSPEARRLRPGPRTGRGARALRLFAAVRPRRVEPLRRPGVEPADSAGAAAGGGGRAAGDGGPALVGHARQGLRVAAAGLFAALGPGVLALIEDLEQRGLLSSTLVIAWGEFGRTPKVNADAGRDHYPNVFSAALAGGPVKGGRVVGSSDAKGAFPKADPKTPLDVLATLYHHLGVDTAAQYPNGTGRPISVLPEGKAIEELF